MKHDIADRSLAEAGSLIGAVSNADHRAELVTLYEQRATEMEAA